MPLSSCGEAASASKIKRTRAPPSGRSWLGRELQAGTRRPHTGAGAAGPAGSPSARRADRSRRGRDIEQLAYYSFLAGFITSTIAATTYVLTTVGSLTTYRQAATEAGVVRVPVRFVLPGGVGATSRSALNLALVLLTASIVFRAIAVERPPVGNLWEYTVALGWGIVLFTAIFETAFHERSLGAVMLPAAVALMAVAIAFFPAGVTPLVPALQANRILGLHVTTMVLAYSALSISSGAAILYLIQADAGGRRFGRLPHADTFGEVGYWSVLVGFPLLTLGIALGAYWANSAWGRYWSA